MNKQIKDLIEYPKEGVLSKSIHKNNKADLTLFCMARGSVISEHTSTKHASVYIVEGNGEFKLSGKSIKMSPGTIIFMKENEVHSLKAEENTSFILSLIK